MVLMLTLPLTLVIYWLMEIYRESRGLPPAKEKGVILSAVLSLYVCYTANIATTRSVPWYRIPFVAFHELALNATELSTGVFLLVVLAGLGIASIITGIWGFSALRSWIRK